jgi:hypothetical protein
VVSDEDDFEQDRDAAVDRFWRRKRADAAAAEERAAANVGVRYSEPVTTTRSLPKSAPAPSRGISGRDLAIIEGCSRAAGELIARVQKDLAAEIAALREDFAKRSPP